MNAGKCVGILVVSRGVWRTCRGERKEQMPDPLQKAAKIVAMDLRHLHLGTHTQERIEDLVRGNLSSKELGAAS